MKILHIVPARPFGGLQRLAVNLVDEQRHQGLDANILAVYQDERFSNELNEKGIPFTETRGGRFNFSGYIDYIRGITQNNLQIVHLHSGLLWTNALGLLLKRCPWIYHAHVFWTLGCDMKSKINAHLTSRVCDGYIGVSNAVSLSLRNSISKNKPITTIHNGIPIQDCPPRYGVHDRSRPHFGMATRFVPDKGVFEFIDVCKNIANHYPGSKFTLAGDGPLLCKAKLYAKESNLKESISFPGFVRDIQSFWASLDIAIFTAVNESFGLCIIEPIACGTPVVAYRTGSGSDEIIVHGKTGFLVNEYGDVNTMTEQCSKLISDWELWSRISMTAYKEVVVQFSVKRMADSIKQFYEIVLKDKRQ